MTKTSLTLVAAALCLSVRAAEQPDTRPPAEQAYAGLFCSDHPQTGGMLVGWVLPGPLKGTTFASPHMSRGDIILSVNGKPMAKKAFYELVERSKPGDALALRVRVTKGPGGGGTPIAGKGGEEKTVRLVLASKADWCGPISFKRPAKDRPDPNKVLPLPDGPTPLETFLNERIDANGLRKPLDKLLAYFAETQDKNLGFHSLRRVACGFYRPTRLPELQKLVTDPLPKLIKDPRDVLARAAENLDLAPPKPGDPPDLSQPTAALAWVKAHLAEAARLREKALARIPAKRRKALAKDLRDLLDHLASNHYLSSHPEAGRLMAAMRESMKIDYDALLGAAAQLAGAMRPGKPPAKSLPSVPLPKALAGAVEGTILAAEHADGRWLVYGGHGPNRYDMSKLDAVLDAGGDDVYTYPKGGRPPVQLVVDFAGDDRHEGEAIGPASALMGVSLLVDAKGNDRYVGRSQSCGVGVMGVGVLVDLGGNDTYSGAAWSLGVGVYGCGAVLDLGKGADTYLAEFLSQGVGGPRGFGLLLDQSGRDLYRANGPRGSSYGTPAVFSAFSQGVGFGVRHYDSGGIGVLCDLGGHDRYEAGEFSQGGAYYWGLGILHDRAGDDLYYGNRYAQGFGVHQALGILADDAGDDTYWAMTAASQGAAWDIGVGLLIDRAGNDSYQADGLSQGSAAMQGIGWLLDLGGTDRYVGRGTTVHGRSGGNRYHYADTGCFSWSLLLDAGGTPDHYSTGRPNGKTLAPGKLNEKQPADSGLHGLFIDTPVKTEF